MASSRPSPWYVDAIVNMIKEHQEMSEVQEHIFRREVNNFTHHLLEKVIPDSKFELGTIFTLLVTFQRRLAFAKFVSENSEDIKKTQAKLEDALTAAKSEEEEAKIEATRTLRISTAEPDDADAQKKASKAAKREVKAVQEVVRKTVAIIDAKTVYEGLPLKTPTLIESFVASLIVSVKTSSDEYYINPDFVTEKFPLQDQQETGIDHPAVKGIKTIERQFLNGIQYNLSMPKPKELMFMVSKYCEVAGLQAVWQELHSIQRQKVTGGSFHKLDEINLDTETQSLVSQYWSKQDYQGSGQANDDKFRLQDPSDEDEKLKKVKLDYPKRFADVKLMGADLYIDAIKAIQAEARAKQPPRETTSEVKEMPPEKETQKRPTLETTLILESFLDSIKHSDLATQKKDTTDFITQLIANTHSFSGIDILFEYLKSEKFDFLREEQGKIMGFLSKYGITDTWGNIIKTLQDRTLELARANPDIARDNQARIEEILKEKTGRIYTSDEKLDQFKEILSNHPTKKGPST